MALEAGKDTLTRMKKLIPYLTIALVGVGLMILVTEFKEPLPEKFFKDAEAFNKAFEAEIKDEDMPPLPPCAQTIAIERTGNRVDAINFICEDVSARETFRQVVLVGYPWEVEEENGSRVFLTRLIFEDPV